MKRIFIFFAISLVVLTVFVVPFFAHAQDATNPPSSLGTLGNKEVSFIGPPVKWLMYLTLVIESFFITLSGMLVGVALQFNMSILSFDPPFITIGWQIFRDIANLGFVLGIVIIAVATILRIKAYQAKQILWKLITAALVVNFSLLMGGIIIQPANSISKFLMNYIGSGDYASAAKIGDAMRFVDLMNSGGLVGGATGEVVGWISGGLFGESTTFFILATMAVLLVFGLVMFLTLISFAGMLFLRFFNLAFLLMISPVVWLLWIFPHTKSYFKDWWEKFIHWTIFAPFMLLFLYIALLVLDEYSKNVSSLVSEFPGSKGLGIDFGLLVTSLFAVAILLGGLKMASKMGHGGTKLALGAVDSGQKWAKSKMANYKKSTTDVAKRGEARARKAGLDSKWGQKLQGGFKAIAGSDSKLLKYTGLRRVAEGVTLGIETQKIKAGKTIQGYTENQKKRLKDASSDQLYSLLSSVKDPEKRSAIVELIGERDKKYDKKKLVAAGMNDAEMEGMFLQMHKTGRVKEASETMKKMGTSLDMYEYARKRKAKKPNKFEGDVGISNIGTDDEYIYSDREKDENGKPKKIYKKDVVNGIEKYSEQDLKNLAASVSKEMFSSVPPKRDPFVPEEFADDMTKKIMDMMVDPFTKFYQSFSSKLDKGELKNHYAAVVDHLIKKVDTKTDGATQNAARIAFSAGNYEKAVNELRRSNEPNIARMANKINKSIGAQLSHVSGEKGEEPSNKQEGERKQS